MLNCFFFCILNQKISLSGPPDAPYDSPVVSETGTHGHVTRVTWCSPAYDGGCALTGYSLECRRIAENTWKLIAENCHTLGHEVTDLEPGVFYVFRVRALNIHGSSQPSPESKAFRVPMLEMDRIEDKLKVEEDEAELEEGKEKKILQVLDF